MQKCFLLFRDLAVQPIFSKNCCQISFLNNMELVKSNLRVVQNKHRWSSWLIIFIFYLLKNSEYSHAK